MKEFACEKCLNNYPTCKETEFCGVQSVIAYKERIGLGMLKCGEVAIRQSELKQLQSNIEVYKNALDYFIKEGGKPAEDIAKNLLKELEG